MKTILVSLILLASISQAAFICKNQNKDTNLESIVIFDRGTLMAVCQRTIGSTKPNEEICGQDFFNLKEFAKSGGKEISKFESINTGVILDFTITGSQAQLVLTNVFSSTSIKGGNKITLAKGKIDFNCVTK